MKKLLFGLVMMVTVILLTACGGNLDAFELLDLSREAEADIESLVVEIDADFEMSVEEDSVAMTMAIRLEVESEDQRRFDTSMEFLGQREETTTYARDGYMYVEERIDGDVVDRSRSELTDTSAADAENVFFTDFLSESTVEDSSASSIDDGYRLEFILNMDGVSLIFDEFDLGEVASDQSDSDEEEFDNTMVVYLDEDYIPTSVEISMPGVDIIFEGEDATVVLGIMVTTVQIGNVTIDFPDWLDVEEVVATDLVGVWTWEGAGVGNEYFLIFDQDKTGLLFDNTLGNMIIEEFTWDILNGNHLYTDFEANLEAGYGSDRHEITMEGDVLTKVDLESNIEATLYFVMTVDDFASFLEDLEEGSESSTAETPDDLSDDLYSFMFSLNGVIYSLPFSYTEFEENGWGGDDLDEDTLNPNQFSLVTPLTNGNYQISVSFINLTENVLSFSESNIGRITLDAWNYNRGGAELIFPGGITMGSTYEEVIAAYGEPSSRREGSLDVTLTYSPNHYTGVEVRIDNDTNLVTSLRMENFVEREDSPDFEGDLPEVVLAYESPTDLGDDWRDFIVRFDGDLYQLPAPVAVFLENGWVIEGDANEMVAAQSSRVGVRLRKGNQTMRTTVQNYDNSAQPIVNGFVTVIDYYHHDATLPIELPGGITEDSTIEEVIAAFGEPDRVEESSSLTFYTFGSIWQQISITINEETSEIQRLSVQHSPNSLD